jgi:hypothetical protein
MPQIIAIIEAIENTSIGALTETPFVFKLKESTDSVRQTPSRVIIPMQNDNEGSDMEYLALGGSLASINWTLADLLLFKPAGENISIQSALPELLAYIDNYILAFQSFRKLGLTHATIETIDYEWNIFTFPEGSKYNYYGVLMTLRIKEIIE